MIGLISDTHGLVRPEVFDVFRGVELILHAGDVGNPGVLVELATIAPVRAVRGNVDDPFEPAFESTLTGTLQGVSYRVTHGNELGQPKPEALLARYHESLVVYGHTHQPVVFRRRGRLVVNPGSAGPRRFSLPVSVALLEFENGEPRARLVTLG